MKESDITDTLDTVTHRLDLSDEVLTLRLVADILGMHESELRGRMVATGMLDEQGVPTIGRGAGMASRVEIRTKVWVVDWDRFRRAWEFWGSR